MYRVGIHIPTPGIDGKVLAGIFERAKGTFLGFFDMFAGGGLERLSIFALGIMPYISASIILQLLTVVIPTLERLSKEGEAGRRKITQYTRYGTVVISLIQGLWHCGRSRTDAGCRRRAGCVQSRMGLQTDDNDHPDGGHIISSCGSVSR